MIDHILSGLKNKHISVPIVAAIFLEILPIWVPSIKPQCQETQKVLLAYGVLAAANSGPKQ